MEEVATEGGWVSGDYGDFLGLSSEERAIVEQRAERARLEREVIEAAKAYGRAARAVEDHMKKCNEAGSDPAAGWQLLRDMESTQEDLMLEAVWPLIEFESNQQRGK